MIKQEELEWGCVGHDNYGAIWALGKRFGINLINIKAIVSRCFDGSWFWDVFKDPEMKETIFDNNGNSQSRFLAMSDAEKFYKAMLPYKKTKLPPKPDPPQMKVREVQEFAEIPKILGE